MRSMSFISVTQPTLEKKLEIPNTIANSYDLNKLEFYHHSIRTLPHAFSSRGWRVHSITNVTKTVTKIGTKIVSNDLTLPELNSATITGKNNFVVTRVCVKSLKIVKACTLA